MPAALNELVAARTFPDTEIWTLLGDAHELRQPCRSCRHIFMVGRLKANVEVSAAEADLARIYQSLSAQFPREYRSRAPS